LIHIETSFLVDFLREMTRRRPGKATAFVATAEQQERRQRSSPVGHGRFALDGTGAVFEGGCLQKP